MSAEENISKTVYAGAIFFVLLFDNVRIRRRRDSSRQKINARLRLRVRDDLHTSPINWNTREIRVEMTNCVGGPDVGFFRLRARFRNIIEPDLLNINRTKHKNALPNKPIFAFGSKRFGRHDGYYTRVFYDIPSVFDEILRTPPWYRYHTIVIHVRCISGFKSRFQL